MKKPSPKVTDRAVREPERQRITGVSRPGWYLAELRGVVPRRRMQPGLRVAYWLESELLAWLRGEWKPDEQKADQDTKAIVDASRGRR